MLNTIAFLGQTVPDLNWEPQEIIALDDGRFVVRGLATGTPTDRIRHAAGAGNGPAETPG